MNELKSYFVDITENDIDILNQRIAKYGVDEIYNRQLHFLDCSRKIRGEKGYIRAIQTIDYTYKFELSLTVYLIDAYMNDEHYDDYVNQLVIIHKNNLEYEKDNPPVIYKTKGNKKSLRNSSPVEKRNETTRLKLPKVKKEKDLSILKFKMKLV